MRTRALGLPWRNASAALTPAGPLPTTSRPSSPSRVRPLNRDATVMVCLQGRRVRCGAATRVGYPLGEASNGCGGREPDGRAARVIDTRTKVRTGPDTDA